MRAQIQQLQREKAASLTRVQRIEDQHNTNTGLLQRTAANVQNTANTAASETAHLSTSVSQQLTQIQNLVTAGFAQVNKDLRKSFHNQNVMYRLAEDRHQEYNELFQRMEKQLAALGVQQRSPQPRRIQQQAVPLLEQAAAAAAPPL